MASPGDFPDERAKLNGFLLHFKVKPQRRTPWYILVLEGFMSAGLGVATLVCVLYGIMSQQLRHQAELYLAVLGAVFAGAAGIVLIFWIWIQLQENRHIPRQPRPRNRRP